MTPQPCPQCSDPASFSKRRNQYFCAECDLAFDGEIETPQHTLPPVALKPLKLFLSYGRDDYVQEVKALRDALRSRGHEAWFDEEQLGTGLDWEQRIEKGLAWCDRVVLTMTPHSVRRPDGYCLNEIAKALELRKPIIPVLLVEVPQGAPTSICRIQYLDWRDAVPAAERVERFHQRLVRLCEAIEEDKLDFEGGQQRLIRHLQPLNFDGDLQRHVASFKGRVQLEARLRAWLADPAASQVLWLTAAPGLGKSAVAATLSHRWAEVAAVHFCVAGHQDKVNPARAVLSIAYQLSQREHMSLYAARLANLELEREAHKDARTLFDTLLVGPLANNFPEPPTPLLVILDGLDEAIQPSGENPLAEIVAADWGRLPSWLRLMVSSRPEAELVQWLGGVQRIEIRNNAEQQADLAAFLRERLAAIGHPPSEGVLARILQRSEGAFHYAVLLVEELRQGRCDPENPVDLPAGLNPFYLQTFKRRFPDMAAYRSQTRPLLELILAAPEPVPLAVLAGATKRDARDVRQYLSALGSMVTIEPGQDETDVDWDTARLSHTSLRSWLTGLDATRRSLAGPFAAKVDIVGLSVEVLRVWEISIHPVQNAENVVIKRSGFVLRTLAIAIRQTEYWNEIEFLDAAADFLLSNDRFEDSITLRLRTVEINRNLHGESALQTAHAMYRLGEAYFYFEEMNKAYRLFRKVFRIRKAVLGKRHPDVLQSLQDAAVTRCDSHNKISAIIFLQVLNERLQQFGEIHLKTAESLNSVGGVYFDRDDYDAALSYMERALAASLQCQPSDNRAVLKYSRDVAICLDFLGRKDTARERMEMAVSKAKTLFGNRHSMVAESLQYLGTFLWHNDQADAAVKSLEEALDITIEIYGTSHTNVIQCLSGLARAHMVGGESLKAERNFVEALNAYRKVLKITERLSAIDPYNAGLQNDLKDCHNSIGDVLEELGILDEALGEFRKSKVILERLTVQDLDNLGWQVDLGSSYNRIANVLEAQGNLTGALEEFRKMQEICERLAVQDPDNEGWQSDLSNSYNLIGNVLEAQGNLAGALEEYSKALAIAERLAGQDPDNAGWQSDLGISYNRIGYVLEAQGNLAGALDVFCNALAIRETLAAQDLANVSWQRNVAISHASVAGSQLALRDFVSASSSLKLAKNAFRVLLDTEDAGSLIDYAVTVALDVEIAERTEDLGIQAVNQAELLNLELQPEGVVGRFRKRFIPLILAKMEDALNDSKVDGAVFIVLRALRLAAAVPSIDFSRWKKRARELAGTLPPEHELVNELRQLCD